MRVSISSIFLSISLLFSTIASARNLGVMGEVFPIKEPDLLQEIHDKLAVLQQSGQLQGMMQKMNGQAAAQIKRPVPVNSITTTVTPRVWLFNPSIVLHQSVYDGQGIILFPSGTVVNPLSRVHLNETLLFFNGDDLHQVAWAEEQIANTPGTIKPILIQGDWSALMKQWHRPVYFDQQGKLTSRLGLTHVPAKITQAGLNLQIDEEVPPQ